MCGTFSSQNELLQLSVICRLAVRQSTHVNDLSSETRLAQDWLKEQSNLNASKTSVAIKIYARHG